MSINDIYIKHSIKALILRDVDGTEQSISLQDALELLVWLQAHRTEIEAALEAPDEQDPFTMD
jgi:hypothetical protein